MEALLLPIAKFAVGSEHDLQVACEVFFAEQFGNAANTRALVGRNLQEWRIVAGNLGNRDVAQKTNQLTREMSGAVAFAEQFVHEHQDLLAGAFRDRLHHGFESAGRGSTDQAAHGVESEMFSCRGNRLIENRKRVTHGAVAGFG